MTSAEKRGRRNICTVVGGLGSKCTCMCVRPWVCVDLFHERNCGLSVFLRVGLEDVGETGAI